MKEKFISKRFNSSSLERIAQANDIIADYSAQGYKLTLRQLYYQFVSRNWIENTERSYKRLGSTISDARLAGLIDWNAIEDRGRGVTSWLIEENQESALDGVEYNYALDYWAPQETYIEVWVEKEALSSVIAKPCRRKKVNYMPCKGYLSSSEGYEAGLRFRRMAEYLNRRTVLIHLGDHDPSGIDMTRDNDDRLSMFARCHDIEVRRIALNMDQVQAYKPPRNPAKVTDSRYAAYRAKYGDSSWELDALEPRVLDELITRTIDDYVDEDLWEETRDQEREGRAELSAIQPNWGQIKEFMYNEGLV